MKNCGIGCGGRNEGLVDNWYLLAQEDVRKRENVGVDDSLRVIWSRLKLQKNGNCRLSRFPLSVFELSTFGKLSLIYAFFR